MSDDAQTLDDLSLGDVMSRAISAAEKQGLIVIMLLLGHINGRIGRLEERLAMLEEAVAHARNGGVLHRCCDPECPGRPWPASERPHDGCKP